MSIKFTVIINDEEIIEDYKDTDDGFLIIDFLENPDLWLTLNNTEIKFER